MIGTVARSGDPQPRQKAGLFVVISVSAWVGSCHSSPERAQFVSIARL